MRSFLFCIAFALSLSSNASPLDNINTAIESCSSTSTFGEGYCLGVTDIVQDLWITTHMSTDISICKKSNRSDTKKVLLSWLEDLKKSYSLLLALRSSTDDTTNAKSLHLRAISAHNKSSPDDDFSKDFVLATSSVPDWLDKSTPVYSLIMYAYVQTHKCKNKP